MTTAYITSEVFSWAKERAGFTNEKLASVMKKEPEKIRAWEVGSEFPNFNQAQKIANILSIPLGYLFLSHPPVVSVPIADFRTIQGKTNNKISFNLLDTLDDALRKRDWYKEWRITEGLGQFEFVGKFSLQSNSQELIEDIKLALEIEPGYTSQIATWNDHLRFLVQRIESIGILVLQNGIVGNNTHRKLSVDEFRGFVLADQYAPVIFINAQDSISARIFTIIHELIHIWTGTSGISNPELNPDRKDLVDVERFCNKIAADFLVPPDDLLIKWKEYKSVFENTNDLARYFRVSTQVILRHSFELGIINRTEYFETYEEILRTQKKTKNGTGGNFYHSFYSRNSRRFTRTLISSLAAGQLSYLDAARLLNTQPKCIAKVMESAS